MQDVGQALQLVVSSKVPSGQPHFPDASTYNVVERQVVHYTLVTFKAHVLHFKAAGHA